MAAQGDQESSTKDNQKCLPPLYPATDVPAGEYPRARFDDGLSFAIKEEAKLRAPDTGSKWCHELGFASELGVSGLLQTPVNREIYPDYVGDDGYDLLYEHQGSTYQVEVKCTASPGTELSVEESKVDSADYFVLCRTVNPRREVEIIGSISRPRLIALGESFPGSEEVKVARRFLDPFPPIFVGPDRIRDAQIHWQNK